MPSFSYPRSISSRFGNIDARGASTQFIYFWESINSTFYVFLDFIVQMYV